MAFNVPESTSFKQWDSEVNRKANIKKGLIISGAGLLFAAAAILLSYSPKNYNPLELRSLFIKSLVIGFVPIGIGLLILGIRKKTELDSFTAEPLEAAKPRSSKSEQQQDKQLRTRTQREKPAQTVQNADFSPAWEKAQQKPPASTTTTATS